MEQGLGRRSQDGEDGVADLPFEVTDGFPVGLFLTQFLVVVGAALTPELAQISAQLVCAVDGVENLAEVVRKRVGGR